MAKKSGGGAKKTKVTKPVADTNETPITNIDNAQDDIQEEQNMATTLTFTLGSTNKAGQGRYHFPGYAATLFFSKSCFDGDLPTELQIVADGINFATPGTKKAKTPKVTKVLTPEEQAKKDARDAKRKELAGNREAQAEKLRTKLAKLEARIAGKPAKAPKVKDALVVEPETIEEL
jgi:hypothetical protein